jgi:glycosyltransferase involved in cell wall biosynthesis
MITAAKKSWLREWVQQINAGGDGKAALVGAQAVRERSLRWRWARHRPAPKRTRILYLSHYFPPEGNAPANRVYEMCKRWVRDGHEVTVVTCAPNHPNGVVYNGYRNWPMQHQITDGIHVMRVWTFLAANKGRRRRAVSFLSYMVMATMMALMMRRRDVLIATSPQFFCGWAGVLVAALRRIPFILEVRDIWPESITAVGASPRNWLIWLLERMEQQMYASAFKIVTVGPGYKEQLVLRGVPESKIEIVTNGVDRELFTDAQQNGHARLRWGLGKGFVCAYVGTIGMAAGLEIVLRAGKLLRDRGRTDIKFLMVGDGASRQDLQDQALRQGLTNVIFTGLIERGEVPGVLSSVDACLVHLNKHHLFESVLPSKLFEACGMSKPIILGLKGWTARLVQEANAGICIEPENEQQLVAAVEKLAGDPELARKLGKSGHDYVRARFDRDALSRRYFDIIKEAIETCPIVV